MGLMKIIVSSPKNIIKSIYGDNVFVSQPYFKIILENGLGFYILNSYKYYLFPKFYGQFHKTFWEFGFNFAGWTFEIMWNKSFAK